MAGKQQIEFVIRPDGSVEERVTGFSGPDCEQATSAIEKALGEVTRREHTGDFYGGSAAGTASATDEPVRTGG